MRQEISWFDANPTGDLASRMTADTALLQDGISDKCGLIIQFLSAFISGFVIAYVKGWKLALVLTAIIPVLGGAVGILAWVMGAQAKSGQDA